VCYVGSAEVWQGSCAATEALLRSDNLCSMLCAPQLTALAWDTAVTAHAFLQLQRRSPQVQLDCAVCTYWWAICSSQRWPRTAAAPSQRVLPLPEHRALWRDVHSSNHWNLTGTSLRELCVLAVWA
jgi:hypothetical protein